MIKYYVLVSQGIEIFRTTCKEEAEKIMNESNKEFYNYKQCCLDNYDLSWSTGLMDSLTSSQKS